MADHMAHWLRDCGVPVDFDSFETDFSNGYRFGQLLYQLDILPDFDQFKNKGNKEWKVKNFAEVERGLRAMKLKFESKLINQIMDEERGAALRLLFQIKLNHEEAMNPNMTMTGLDPNMVHTKVNTKTFREQKLAHRKGLKPTIKSKKLGIVEEKLLRFEERKEKLELKAIRDQQKEDQMVHEMLMERRQQQIEQLKENKEFMNEWMKKGRKDWTKNKKVTLERIQKGEILEKALTDKYINKIKSNMEEATEEVVGGIDSFEKNLARMGIENEANLDALDESKKPPQSKKPLGGFSFPATMIKIQEKKVKGDFARKERDTRKRKLKVVQEQTQEQVKLKTREEELLSKFTKVTKEETEESYLLWRNEKCRALQQHNLEVKSTELTRKKEMELQRLKDAEDKERDEKIKQYKIECKQRKKEHKQKRMEEFFRMKEIDSLLCGEIMKSILDVVEEAHVTCKAGITKPRWREFMRKFKNNEQIYTSMQVQMEPEEDEEDDADEELDLTNNNDDYVELQNYLSVAGMWRGQSNTDKVREITESEKIEIPDLKDFVNNNSILGKAVKEISEIAHGEEINKVNSDQVTQLLEAKASVPSHMPLKLLMMGEEFEGYKEVLDKVKDEFNLKIFDVKEISAEIEKIINPPQEEEAPDPKKAKGKGAQEEPPENQEELKELQVIADKIKQYRDDNPGVQTISEDHLMSILAIKVKYSFSEIKTDAQILSEIKEGIKQDVFREPEEEGDPKKAKGKGPSKEELEEELTKYKHVQPSGYLVFGVPKSRETLLEFEKVFNGYLPVEERPTTEYEKAKSASDKLFPSSINSQEIYKLEPHNNYLIERSLNLTSQIVSESLEEEKVILIEKNTPKDLAQKFSVIDENYEEYKNLYDDYGKDSIKIPHKTKIDLHVEKTIPAVEEGQEPKEKTPEQIQDEIAAKFRSHIKEILSHEQKVLERIIDENIDVVRQEIEEEKAKAEAAEQEAAEPAKEEPPVEETKEPIEGEGEGNKEEAPQEQPEEVEVPEEPKIGFHPVVVQDIYGGWKQTEKDYAKNMMNMFRSIRKQHDNIGMGTEDMKSNFKDFLTGPDEKQEKLDNFIESFNKFTEEFPELRPDEQTKEELNNRCDILNDEFWEILEKNKDDAINERQRLIDSGWIAHELQQLTVKAQQIFSYEIKRCLSSLYFIHCYFLSQKSVKPLDEYEFMFPQKYSLSLMDESNIEEGQAQLPSIEDAENPHNFPLLTAMFEKAIGVVSEISKGLDCYEPSEFEIIEAVKKEQDILIYRLISIKNWTENGLKDIRLKINESYDVLDDWIVLHVKNENEACNECISNIRNIIESNEALDTDLKFPVSDLQVGEGEETVQFIQSMADKSFIKGQSKSKLNIDQAREYFSIFKRFSRDEQINSDLAKQILITLMKLHPSLIPASWKEHSLSHTENLVNVLQDEETMKVNWRHLISYCILVEAFLPVLDRDGLTSSYHTELKKTLENDLEEYITLEKFLEVGAWYDEYLAMRRKSEVKFEEDKQEIDDEIREVKTLLYTINISSNGLLHIDRFIETLLKLWPKA